MATSATGIPASAGSVKQMNRWVAGARPRTLPAAVVPVVVGTAVAVHGGDLVWWRALAALVVALSVQIGTNYANDYSDGIRGTDEKRVGPVRLVASGLARPHEVKRAAFTAFGVTAIAGLLLAVAVSPWLLVVGIASILAGWFYTGGKHPYGYSGLGELFVFVFFGLVAVLGSQYVQTKELTAVGAWSGVAVGLLAVALLVANNLRDRANDAVAGKRTLAVRLGDRSTRRFYVFAVVAPIAIAVITAIVARPFAGLALLALPLATRPAGKLMRGASGRDLIAVLQATGKLQLAFGGLLAIGLAI